MQYQPETCEQLNILLKAKESLQTTENVLQVWSSIDNSFDAALIRIPSKSTEASIKGASPKLCWLSIQDLA